MVLMMVAIAPLPRRAGLVIALLSNGIEGASLPPSGLCLPRSAAANPCRRTRMVVTPAGTRQSCPSIPPKRRPKARNLRGRRCTRPTTTTATTDDPTVTVQARPRTAAPARTPRQMHELLGITDHDPSLDRDATMNGRRHVFEAELKQVRQR